MRLRRLMAGVIAGAVRAIERRGSACVLGTALVSAAASCAVSDRGGERSSDPEDPTERTSSALQVTGPSEGPTTIDTPIGIALDIDNGSGTPLRVRANQQIYIDQIDIRASTTATVDHGVQDLTTSGDFASLDWRGLSLRDEEVLASPNPDGTFERRRFYRSARWMEEQSVIVVDQLDAEGHPAAPPWTVHVGKGDDRTPADNFFVRRLRAIQYAKNCASRSDCSTATNYVEEALAELRNATRASHAIRLRPSTTALRLRWRNRTYSIPVVQVASPTFDYNFGISIDPLTPTGAGGVYAPGTTLRFRVTFRDGSGTRLHPVGSLPTYLESLTANDSGLQYWNAADPVATYWRRKHREHQMVASIVGPAQAVQPLRSTLGPADLASPDGIVTTGILARDGVFGQAWSFPTFGDLLTGNIAAPVSDEFTFQLPSDAPAGTYLVSLKARRNYLGQELPRTRTIEIQVGTAAHTEATLGTGHCNTCHEGGGALGIVLHGNDNRATCTTCHAPLTFEPEGPVYVRTHFVHSRSGRFDAPLTRCASCHLDKASIARTSQSACLSCHKSYPASHVAKFGPIESAYVGGTLATAFQQCTTTCHTTHPNSDL